MRIKFSLPCLNASWKSLVHVSFFMHLKDKHIAGNEFGGFRCSPGAAHLQCNGCGGMMPARSNINIPQKCECLFW